MLARVLLVAGLALAVPVCRLVARPAAAAGVAPAHAACQGPASQAIRYVANAGVMLRIEGRSFLVDAPGRDASRPVP